MPKQVQLQKIGTVTRVKVEYTENPLIKQIYNIPEASLGIEKDKIIVDSLRCPITFGLDELVDNFGCTNLEDLMNELALRKYFVCDEGLDETGHLTLIATNTSNTVQSDSLIGKASIDLVVVANGVDQNPTNYNSELGSFDFNVIAGDKLTIFYTN